MGQLASICVAFARLFGRFVDAHFFDDSCPAVQPGCDPPEDDIDEGFAVVVVSSLSCRRSSRAITARDAGHLSLYEPMQPGG